MGSNNTKWYQLFEIWEKQVPEDLHALKDTPLELLVPFHAISQMATTLSRYVLTMSFQPQYDSDDCVPVVADMLTVLAGNNDILWIKQYQEMLNEWYRCDIADIDKDIDVYVLEVKIQLANDFRRKLREIMCLFEEYRTSAGWDNIDAKQQQNKAASLLKQAEGN